MARSNKNLMSAAERLRNAARNFAGNICGDNEDELYEAACAYARLAGVLDEGRALAAASLSQALNEGDGVYRP